MIVSPGLRGMRRALVLRPEPGGARTAALLAAAAIECVLLPLFTVVRVDWAVPGAGRFDALLLTSANAVRHAGAGLDALRHLPVVAVGAETAAAARDAGLSVAAVGSGDGAAAMALMQAEGFTRPLHLTGRDHRAFGAATIVCYASDAVAIPPGAMSVSLDRVALLHSVRAARRFAELVERDGVDRSRVGVAALSPAVLAAAGEGWALALAAVEPTDAALVASITNGGD